MNNYKNKYLKIYDPVNKKYENLNKLKGKKILQNYILYGGTLGMFQPKVGGAGTFISQLAEAVTDVIYQAADAVTPDDQLPRTTVDPSKDKRIYRPEEHEEEMKRGKAKHDGMHSSGKKAAKEAKARLEKGKAARGKIERAAER